MTDSLRTDYDRMVGESYKDYAARCRGRMLAAERDRDALRARVAELEPIEQRVRAGEPAWMLPYMQRYILGEADYVPYPCPTGRALDGEA